MFLGTNQAADSLSRHSMGQPEPEKIELLQREIPKQTSERSGGPVLMVIKYGIDTEMVKKWQENNWPSRKMKKWIMR